MIRVYLVFLLGLTFSIANSQKIFTNKPDSTATVGELLKYDASVALKAVGYGITKPLRWKVKDYGNFTGLIAGSILLSAYDDDVNAFFRRQQKDFPKVVRDMGWYFGSPQNYFMTNAGLYGFGLLTKNEKIRKTSVLIVSSSVVSGLVQTIAKNTIGRARPSAGFDVYEFELLSKESRFHSFPSGHTILSVTMAHSIAKQFDNGWIKAGIYTIGAIPPISRLVDDAHWFTDVAISAALSIIIVDSMDKFLFNSKAYDYPTKKKQISWNLRLTGSQIGVVGVF